MRYKNRDRNSYMIVFVYLCYSVHFRQQLFNSLIYLKIPCFNYINLSILTNYSGRFYQNAKIIPTQQVKKQREMFKTRRALFLNPRVISLNIVTLRFQSVLNKSSKFFNLILLTSKLHILFC